MKKTPTHEERLNDLARQRFLEEVVIEARRVWDGEIAEIRVMRNRNGASIFSTERSFHAEKLNK